MKKLMSVLILTLGLCTYATRNEAQDVAGMTGAAQTEEAQAMRGAPTPEIASRDIDIDDDDLKALLDETNVTYEEPSWVKVKLQQLACKIAMIPGVLEFLVKIKHLFEGDENGEGAKLPRETGMIESSSPFQVFPEPKDKTSEINKHD